MRFYKDGTIIEHERKIYTFIDILRDLGGVIRGVALVCAFILKPIAEHSFVMKATKRLFTARTTNDNLFDKKK